MCPRHGLGLRGNTAEPLPLPQVFCAPDQAHCWETQGSAQTCRQSGGGGVPGWPPLPRAQGSCRLPQREGHGAVWKRENALRVWSGEAPAGMEASDRQQAWRCVGEGLGGTVGRSRRRKKPCLESGPRVLGVTVGRRKLRTGHPGAGSPVVHTTLGNEASLQPWRGGLSGPRQGQAAVARGFREAIWVGRALSPQSGPRVRHPGPQGGRSCLRPLHT